MTLIDANELVRARDRLWKDDVVAIPTETVYGLAASIASETALKRVFALKKRPFFDPLIVHVRGFNQAREVVREWPPLADFLARVFWPGPLTLVLPKAESVSSLITSGLDTVAVRHPRHELAEKLIEMVGTPLAAPSANRFGRTSPSLAEHVFSEFPGEDLLVLDGGPCEVGLESTVISFEEDRILILRPGGVTEEDLKNALKRWSRPVTIARATKNQQSPGHMEHHYMPDIPLVIVGASTDFSSASMAAALKEKLGSAPQKPAELVLNSEPEIAARELYAELRRLSLTGADALFVRRSLSKSDGFWEAIWDRLTRAASAEIA